MGDDQSPTLNITTLPVKRSCIAIINCAAFHGSSFRVRPAAFGGAFCGELEKRRVTRTRLEVIATYDNSAGNPFNADPTATVRWGDQRGRR